MDWTQATTESDFRIAASLLRSHQAYVTANVSAASLSRRTEKGAEVWVGTSDTCQLVFTISLLTITDLKLVHCLPVGPFDPVEVVEAAREKLIECSRRLQRPHVIAKHLADYGDERLNEFFQLAGEIPEAKPPTAQGDMVRLDLWCDP